MKKLILSSFALIAFVFVSNSASGQEPADKSLTSSLAVTIPTVMEFTIAAGGEALSLSFADAAELIAGVELPSAVSLNYKSNIPTFVSIRASGFTAGDLTMPSKVLQYKTGAVGSTFAPFTVADSHYTLSGTTGAKNDVGEGNIVVSYKLTPTLEYAPAVYTNTITYTISAK